MKLIKRVLLGNHHSNVLPLDPKEGRGQLEDISGWLRNEDMVVFFLHTGSVKFVAVKNIFS